MSPHGLSGGSAVAAEEVGEQLGPRTHPEVVVQPLDVVVDRGRVDAQPQRDLLLAIAIELIITGIHGAYPAFGI